MSRWPSLGVIHVQYDTDHPVVGLDALPYGLDVCSYQMLFCTLKPYIIPLSITIAINFNLLYQPSQCQPHHHPRVVLLQTIPQITLRWYVVL